MRVITVLGTLKFVSDVTVSCVDKDPSRLTVFPLSEKTSCFSYVVAVLIDRIVGLISPSVRLSVPYGFLIQQQTKRPAVGRKTNRTGCQ